MGMKAEEKLAAIVKIYNTETLDEEGSSVFTHARHNLHGAFIDIQRRGGKDEVSLETITRVMGQLRQIEKILGI